MKIMKFVILCRQHFVYLFLILSLLPIHEVNANQGSATKSLLPAPKPNLLAIHFPDLSKLEPDVREQIESLQNSLAGLVKNAATPDATLSEAYGTMGEIYHAYSLIAPATECYENASRVAPQDFRWVYLLAKIDQQEGRNDEAIRRLQIAADLRPEEISPHLSLAQIYLQSNRLKDAEESFKAALTLDDDLPFAHYGLGQVALSNRDYAAAVKHFEKALKQAPEANRVHYSLAMAYRGLGDIEKAQSHLALQGGVGVRAPDPLIDSLQTLIKGERVHMIRGRLALEAKRFAEAVVEFRKAVAAKPDSIPARINLGAALSQAGELKAAAEQFEETLRLDSTNTIAHYNLAVLLAHEGKSEQAIAHLQSVLGDDPHDLNARFLLAQEYLRIGKRQDALAEFSRVAEADPNNEEAVLEQVKLLQAAGQHKQAIEILGKSQQRYPAKGQTAAMLAYLLAASPQKDLRDGARALTLSKLVYEATGLAQHGALVAMALGELGRCNEAADLIQKLITDAEPTGKRDVLDKLKADLLLYKGKQSCRP